MGFLRDVLEFTAAMTCGMLPLQTYSSLREEQQAEAALKQYEALIPPKLSESRRHLSTSSISPVVQTCALLTKLPLELREMIFQEVLGNSQIHILSLPKRMGHITCQSQDRDHRRLCFPPRERTDPRVLYPWFDGQHNLYPYGHGDQGQVAIWAPPACDFYRDFDLSHSRLPLLQSCRQIYSEAINLLYTKNTFDFAHPRTLIWFTRTIVPERLALIASLQLCLVSKKLGVELSRLWDKMCTVVTTQMPNLKHLSIYLLAEHLHEAGLQGRMLSGFKRLRGLESFKLQLRDLPEDFSNGDGDTEAAASAFVTDLMANVSQYREHNNV